MQKMWGWMCRHRHPVITADTVDTVDTVDTADTDPPIPIEFALKSRRLDITAKTDVLKQSPIRQIKPSLAMHFVMRCKRTACCMKQKMCRLRCIMTL